MCKVIVFDYICAVIAPCLISTVFYFLNFCILDIIIFHKVLVVLISVCMFLPSFILKLQV